MASAVAEQVREFLRAVESRPPGSLAEQRATSEVLWPALTAEVTGAEYVPTDAAGVPAQWIRPPDADPSGVILYLHGGAYCAGSIITHRKLAAHIAVAAGRTALIVDYRLSPEHPFPAALDDAVTAFLWLIDQGISPSRMAIAGDSAGGGLALATALALRDEGRPLPGALVMLSPWTDLAMTGDSVATRRFADPIVNPDYADVTVGWYLGSGEADVKHPLVSPLYADFTHLPPLFVQVGTDEVLLDDSTRLAERAQADGVPVTLDIWAEMIHVFQIGAGNVPESSEAVARIGEWLKMPDKTSAQSP